MDLNEDESTFKSHCIGSIHGVTQLELDVEVQWRGASISNQERGASSRDLRGTVW